MNMTGYELAACVQGSLRSLYIMKRIKRFQQNEIKQRSPSLYDARVSAPMTEYVQAMSMCNVKYLQLGHFRVRGEKKNVCGLTMIRLTHFKSSELPFTGNARLWWVVKLERCPTPTDLT